MAMNTYKFIVPLILAGSLIACHDDSSSTTIPPTPTPTPETFDFEIRVLNITNAQPFSPPFAILHGEDFRAWEVGMSAGTDLEYLAEGGDASKILASQSAFPHVISTTPLAPGLSTVLAVGTEGTDTLKLTVATMLVNTNDAISGVTGLDVSGMQVGDMRVYLTPALDAGTENNTEAEGTIPGPADMGEGFNAERDDVNGVVTYHGGVVGTEGANPGSTLSSQHRFDNPVMRIEVVRK